MDNEGPCPNGEHCCCCGPGESCCDCGEIMPTINVDLTRQWADRFRQSAADMSTDPPEGIDPLIWSAQREAFLAQARELDRQDTPDA